MWRAVASVSYRFVFNPRRTGAVLRDGHKSGGWRPAGATARHMRCSANLSG